MRSKYLLVLIIAVLAFACKKETIKPNPGNGPGSGPGTGNPLPPPPPPPPATALLKDITTQNVPSPYYHLEYDNNGKINFISFASDFFRYKVTYGGSKIIRMQNDLVVNKDILDYEYDADGKLIGITFSDSTGAEIRKLVRVVYTGQQITGIEWRRKQLGAFVLEKTMQFSYYADSNLKRITHHRPANDFLQQPEQTYFEDFSEYDNKINVDEFTLTHNDFFDHVILLPVKLQKNNPGRVILSGVDASYEVTYNYIYNDKNVPTERTGFGTITTGINQDQQFLISTNYTYY